MFFNNMVEKIELEDHNPPTFPQILYFCSKVDEWIKQKSTNVVVIHCKAGKVYSFVYALFQSCLYLIALMYIGSHW